MRTSVKSHTEVNRAVPNMMIRQSYAEGPAAYVALLSTPKIMGKT